jgi:isoleucyl-tRNA synthetase
MDQIIEPIEALNIPENEVRMRDFWIRQNIQDKSDNLNNTVKNVRDGPPFPSSNDEETVAHHGHLLISTLKDVVGRFETQNGNRVIRINGFDTHGTPVEIACSKHRDCEGQDHCVHSKDEEHPKSTLNMNVAEKNQLCSEFIHEAMPKFVSVLKKLGRWADYDKQYYTADFNYMQSVWWAISELYKKGLVYRAKKVGHYSPGIATSVSNFESTLNMLEVSELCVTVAFRLTMMRNTLIVIWTTTPWTLIANNAICVNENFDYVIFMHDEMNYIISYETWNRNEEIIDVLNLEKKSCIISKIIKGSELVGLEYQPIFYYNQQEKFIIISDDYVQEGMGTGCVHQAAAFGEDDYRICKKNNIIDEKGSNVYDPLDKNCRYTDECKQFAGMYIRDKETEAAIIKYLIHKGCLISKNTRIVKEAHCWRTDKQLIYRAQDSWFINVSSLKEQLIKEMDHVTFYPHSMKKNMMDWLNNAKDWNISRDGRWWGTPIPIWTSEDGNEIFCPSSIDELKERSEIKEDINNMHIEFIDHITVPSLLGNAPLKRVKGVLDCWVESACVPHASLYYPFHNKELFKQTYQADFVTEGREQIRLWFYCMHVINCALFGKAPYKNVFCTGLVLGADGKKMSKRSKNYTSPQKLLVEHGADSFRLYVTDSPVVEGGDICFKDKGVHDIAKSIVVPLWNSLNFFTECFIFNTKKYNITDADLLLLKNPIESVSNLLAFGEHNYDVWLKSITREFCDNMYLAYSQYEYAKLTPLIRNFIENLNNWYIKLNRSRLKGFEGYIHAGQGLHTLMNVLITFVIYTAPIMPFISERVYQELLKYFKEYPESVHLCLFKNCVQFEYNEKIVQEQIIFQNVIYHIRNLRNVQLKINSKHPISLINIYCNIDVINIIKTYEQYLLIETNTMEIVYHELEEKLVEVKYVFDLNKFRSIVDKQTAGNIIKEIKQKKLTPMVGMIINDCLLTENMFSELYSPLVNVENCHWNFDNKYGLLISINKKRENSEQEILYNELRILYTTVQKMRKNAKLHPWDKVRVEFINEEKTIDINYLQLLLTKDHCKGNNKEMVNSLIVVLSNEKQINEHVLITEYILNTQIILYREH